jgi:DNA polymerase-3 subunit alpha
VSRHGATRPALAAGAPAPGAAGQARPASGAAGPARAAGGTAGFVRPAGGLAAQSVRAAERRQSAGGTPDPGGAASSRKARQRVFIKIAARVENADTLTRLKALLAEHPGPLEVVLFYENGQKTIALSETYRVKPSPELIRGIEELLGEGTAKVK